jgi:hypothetical protein
VIVKLLVSPAPPLAAEEPNEGVGSCGIREQRRDGHVIVGWIAGVDRCSRIPRANTDSHGQRNTKTRTLAHRSSTRKKDSVIEAVRNAYRIRIVALAFAVHRGLRLVRSTDPFNGYTLPLSTRDGAGRNGAKIAVRGKTRLFTPVNM